MVGRLYNMSCQCQMPWACYIVYQLYNHVIKSNAGRSYGMPVIPSYDMPVIQSCQCQLPSAGAMVCQLYNHVTNPNACKSYGMPIVQLCYPNAKYRQQVIWCASCRTTLSTAMPAGHLVFRSYNHAMAMQHAVGRSHGVQAVE